MDVNASGTLGSQRDPLKMRVLFCSSGKIQNRIRAHRALPASPALSWAVYWFPRAASRNTRNWVASHNRSLLAKKVHNQGGVRVGSYWRPCCMPPSVAGNPLCPFACGRITPVSASILTWCFPCVSISMSLLFL